mmetsp:Transcript_7995/g.15635  ORF Transcript_7995/g.15635 Transcript_7995/m.15635 type:complete len:273 (-) Transcript_7995:1917-2735(-)
MDKENYRRTEMGECCEGLPRGYRPQRRPLSGCRRRRSRTSCGLAEQKRSEEGARCELDAHCASGTHPLFVAHGKEESSGRGRGRKEGRLQQNPRGPRPCGVEGHRGQSQGRQFQAETADPRGEEHPHHLGAALRQQRASPWKHHWLCAERGRLLSLLSPPGLQQRVRLRHGRVRDDNRDEGLPGGAHEPADLRQVPRHPQGDLPVVQHRLRPLRPHHHPAADRDRPGHLQASQGQWLRRGEGDTAALRHQTQQIPCRSVRRGHVPEVRLREG